MAARRPLELIEPVDREAFAVIDRGLWLARYALLVWDRLNGGRSHHAVKIKCWPNYVSRSRCSLRARKPCWTQTVANSVYEIIGSIDLASSH